MAGQVAVAPDGNLITAKTAFTSGATYDATKWNTPSLLALVAAATDSAEKLTRTNLASAPNGDSGWPTTSTYNSTYDATMVRPDGGMGARKWSKGASDTGQYFPYGRAAGSSASTSTAGTPAVLVGLPTVTPGLPYGAGLYMQSTLASPKGSLTFRWYDANGNSVTGVAASSTTVSNTANTWKWYSHVATAPAGAVALSVENVLDMGTGVSAAGAVTWGTMAIIEQRSTAPTAAEWFDGDTTLVNNAYHKWSGMARNSTSTEYTSGTVVKRDTYGNFSTTAPRSASAVVNKSYVDGLVQSQYLTVNVANYLDANRVVGTTDDRPAIMNALGTGAFPIRVYFPQGHYWIGSAILQPSYSELDGAGMDQSFIHLLPTASNSTYVVTNSDRVNGNKYLRCSNLTLDWGVSTARPGGAGGTRSSCLNYGYVENFWITRVKGINSGLHCFDISQGSEDYAYVNANPNGYNDDPNVWAPRRSKYGWVTECEGTNWGDDGITTHGSDYLWISRNRLYDPWSRGNANGIEVDGGSRYVTLTDNWTGGCYGGVEIKGHQNENAAQNTVIHGHVDVGSVRSYNFRHIGHHEGTDYDSKTAFGIIASNLVALFNNNAKGFQDDASPRALCISAYVGVKVYGLLAVGDPAGYTGQGVYSAVAVQYRAKNVLLSGLDIRQWFGVDQDISVTDATNVVIMGAHIYQSSRQAVYVGSAAVGVKIIGMQAIPPLTGALRGAGFYNSDQVEMTASNFTGYPVAVQADGDDYATAHLWTRRVRNLPAGVTRLLDLDPAYDYYITSAQWPAFTTDRPAPAASAGGAYIVEHSRNYAGASVKVTLTRNTTAATPAMYWRMWDYKTKAASSWQQVTATAVANSTT